MLAEAMVFLFGIYSFLGLVFASLFVCFGAPRLDPAVAKSSRMFRLILLPGSAALWPLLLWKWASS